LIFIGKIITDFFDDFIGSLSRFLEGNSYMKDGLNKQKYHQQGGQAVKTPG